MRHQSWKPAGKKIRFHSPGRMTSLTLGLRRRTRILLRRRPKAGKISGNSIHPAGEHHDPHQDHQHAARLDGIFYHPLMSFKEIQYRSGKHPHREERDHKAQSVNTNKGVAYRRGTGRESHQQDTGQGWAYAGRPGKAAGKS